MREAIISENYEADVSEVVYAGPPCVERGIYEIAVKVKPVPSASSEFVTLRGSGRLRLRSSHTCCNQIHLRFLAKTDCSPWSLLTIRSRAKRLAFLGLSILVDGIKRMQPTQQAIQPGFGPIGADSSV